MTKGFPIYGVILTYAIVALLFPDRWNYLSGLCLAVIFWLGCRSLGRRLLTTIPEPQDSWFFPAGLGVVLACTSILFSVSSHIAAILIVWASLGTFSLLEASYLTKRVNWKHAIFTPLVLLAFWSSFTPTTFYDALAYHLGLPYQYVAYGKMAVLPNQLFSTFPPFEQTLNLLFVGVGSLSGIKLVSLILYLSLIHVFCDIVRRIAPDNFDSQFVCWVLLLFPAPWILIHLITADLLVSLFFCCGIALLINQTVLPPKFRILIPSAFISFAILTKLNCLLYTAFLPILVLSLPSEKKLPEKMKMLLVQGLFILLFISPFLVRNYLVTGDPLYPALKKVFHKSDWTEEQQLALRQDSFSRRENILLSVVQTPVLFALRKGSFGAAAEPGLAFLVGSLMYLFVRKNPVVNRILSYTLICYVAWLLTFFSFRQFIPVFVLLALPSVIGLETLLKRSRIIFFVLLLSISVQFIFCLVPVFNKFFPLISFQQTQSEYLRANLDYFPAAEKMNGLYEYTKMLFVGETRGAYIWRTAIVNSRYNYNPLFNWVAESRDVNDLVNRFQNENVEYIFCNWREYQHVIVKSGILYLDLLPPRFRDAIPANRVALSGAQIRTLSDHDAKLLREFLNSYAIPIWQSDGTFYLYELRFNGTQGVQE